MSQYRVALLWARDDDPWRIHDLAIGLRDLGHRPWLISSHRGLPRWRNEDGVEVRRNWRPPETRLRRRGFESYLSQTPASYLSLHRGSPDVAHAFDPPDAAAAASWSRASGRPAVFSFMEVLTRSWIVARRRRLQCTLRAVHGCAAVVVLSRFAAEAFDTTLGVRPRVIPPGIDLSRFAAQADRSASPSILFTGGPGALGPLREALTLVRRERTDATLVLPHDQASASELAREPGIQLAEPGPGAYGHAWVSLVAPGSAGLAPQALESLASGTPVLAAARGSLPEVIDRPEIGAVSELDQPAVLARAILEAFELAAAGSTAAACRARAADFSVERWAAAYGELYRELSGR